MDKELTMKLVKRFPVLYQDFYSPMQQTCMCWGFDHQSGWSEIIWQLSLAIEEELGYSWFQCKTFLLKKRFARRWNNLVYKVSPVVHDMTKTVGKGTHEEPYRRVVVEKAKPRLPWVKRLVWYPNTGFAVQQVKEKFGTLRYYCQTNDRISAFINLAETLSAHICETCGKAGELASDSGWYSTLCSNCRTQRRSNKWTQT